MNEVKELDFLFINAPKFEQETILFRGVIEHPYDGGIFKGFLSTSILKQSAFQFMGLNNTFKGYNQKIEELSYIYILIIDADIPYIKIPNGILIENEILLPRNLYFHFLSEYKYRGMNHKIFKISK